MERTERVNLLYGDPETRNGYLNIDPFARGGNSIACDITNLDLLLDDAECNEILALDVINYINPTVLVETVQNWIKKLRKGGILKIGGTEFDMIINRYSSGYLTIDEANKILFGDQNNNSKIKRNCYNSDDMTNFLVSEGMRVVYRKFSGVSYYIEAQK